METPPNANADHRFVEYYTRNSASDRSRKRFDGVRRVALELRKNLGETTQGLDVVDIGCGAGTQTIMWAEAGHRISGIDISAPLIDVARRRASEVGVAVNFLVGSANVLDLPDSSADVVLVPELLEHLVDWETCVDEAARILRPGGVIYISTTNRLCPVQQEFTLPAYSWYPPRLKKYCERLSTTTHPHWVQHATFPAVHWFTYYQLRDYLDARGITTLDRFDIMQPSTSRARAIALAAIRASRLLRFGAHVLTPYTVAVGHRRREDRLNA